MSAAFYLMPSRSWELMSGALLAFTLTKKNLTMDRYIANLLAVTGLMALVISVTQLSGENFFPGPAASLPVLGTLLLLAVGGQSSTTYISSFLASRPLVYLGKISYPLYLWHWPVLVVMRSRRLYEESIWLDLLGLLLSLILAILTFEIVEKQSWRRLKKLSSKRIVTFGLTGSAIVFFGAILLGAWVRLGWSYSSEELRLDASRKDMPKLDCMFQSGLPNQVQMDTCFADSKKSTVLLWGDSHANHWRPAVSNAAIAVGLNEATLTMNACRPLPGPVGQEDCVKFNQFVIANLPLWRSERNLVGLVLSARWPEGTGTLAPSISDRASWKSGEFFDKRARNQQEALGFFEKELRTILNIAKSNELKVLLVLPSPIQRFAASHCLAILPELECHVAETDMKNYANPAEVILRRVASEFDMVRLIEPRKFMCENDQCPVIDDGVIIYTDDDHISKSYSSKNSKSFESSLAWVASR